MRGRYGKNRNRDLLYCRTCGKRFAATQARASLASSGARNDHHAAEGIGVRATARLLELDKDTDQPAVTVNAIAAVCPDSSIQATRCCPGVSVIYKGTSGTERPR